MFQNQSKHSMNHVGAPFLRRHLDRPRSNGKMKGNTRVRESQCLLLPKEASVNQGAQLSSVGYVSA